MYRERLRARIRLTSETAAQLDESVARDEWLLGQLTTGMAEADIEALLADPQLGAADKAILSARLAALRTKKGWISFAVSDVGGGRRSVSYLGHTAACWHAYLGQVDADRLHENKDELRYVLQDRLPGIVADLEEEFRQPSEMLEHARMALARPRLRRPVSRRLTNTPVADFEAFILNETRHRQAAYEAACRDAETVKVRCIEQFRRRLAEGDVAARIEDFLPTSDHPFRHELEAVKLRHGWQRLLKQPFERIIEQLGNVPDEFVEEVLEVVQTVAVGSDGLFDDRLHRFLADHHRRLARTLTAPAPDRRRSCRPPSGGP